MTAPVVASTAIYNDTANAASIAISKPSGTVEGDWLILHVCNRSTETVSCTGFTEVYSATVGVIRETVLKKKAGSSEPSSYTVEAASGTPRWAAAIARITGGDSTDIIDVVGTAATGTDDAPISPSITTTVADALVMRFLTFDTSSGTYTLPSGLDEEWNADPDAGGRPEVVAASLEQASAGSSGTATWAKTNEFDWITNTVSLAPAGGAEEPEEQPAIFFGCVF